MKDLRSIEKVMGRPRQTGKAWQEEQAGKQKQGRQDRKCCEKTGREQAGKGIQ